jgi:cysteine-rich repeat protein
MIKHIATRFLLGCMVLGLAASCGGMKHDVSMSAISDDGGPRASGMRAKTSTGGTGSAGSGAIGSGSPNASGSPTNGSNPFGIGAGTGAAANPNAGCGPCDGICLLGFVCYGGSSGTPPTAPPTTTPPPRATDAGTSSDGGPTGAFCQVATDCTSRVCRFFTCAAPSCGDNACNGDENAKTCAGDCPTRCGDGVTSGTEECDDGNTTTERCAYGLTQCSVCDATCHKIAGFTSYCGDRVLTKEDSETCDDGNATSGDGCDANCHVEPLASCGNNMIDTKEQCDDGNKDNFDGCNAACKTETGWACPSQPGPCHEICGDKLVVGKEVCDDGNTDDADYCSNDCKTVRRCGDGVVQTTAGETCDDGKMMMESCAYGDMSCKACTVDCKSVATRYCGDGKVTDSEQCDDGNTVTEACAYGQMSCTVCAGNESSMIVACTKIAGATSYCGDGRTDTKNSEQCDDGNTVTETCSYGDRSCKACSANCQSLDAARYCGDGRVTNDEQCDDGNNVTESCAYGQMSCTICNANCQNASGATSYCGDGVLDTAHGEGCDDGNTTSGDGCSQACSVEHA